jgi:hypothetical protein
MTPMPDARAREIAEGIVAPYYGKTHGGIIAWDRWGESGKLIDSIAAALTRARDEENEACAKVLCSIYRGEWTRLWDATPVQRDGAWTHRYLVRPADKDQWQQCAANATRQRRTPGAAEGERTDG